MKKLNRIIFLCILPLLVFGSCVSTKVFSLKDPAYEGHRFNRVLVFGDFSKIEFEKQSEDNMSDDLRSDKVFARSSYQLLPPLRHYSDSEKVAVYRKNGFDCYMIVSTTGTNTQDYHVPTYTTGNVAVTGSGNTAYGYGNSESSGGYTEKETSSVDFQLELFDFANGHLICRCQAESNIPRDAYGNAWASMNTVVSAACSHLVDELMRNNLFYASTF
jgi:hypothetical protein